MLRQDTMTSVTHSLSSRPYNSTLTCTGLVYKNNTPRGASCHIIVYWRAPDIIAPASIMQRICFTLMVNCCLLVTLGVHYAYLLHTNIARGGVLRDKYSTRRSQVLYLSRDPSLSTVFFVQTSKGSALGGILYFE